MFPGMSRLARGLSAAASRAVRAFPRQAAASPAAPVADYHMIEAVAGALRDRLSAIEGFSELLARGSGADRATAGRHILESSGELNRFLANLQDFVRHETGKLSLAEIEVDAAELVQSALATCRGMAERADVTILARLTDGVDLLCDPLRLRNAIANMVLWTLGAAPAGSVIHLRLLRTPQGGMAVAVTAMVETPPREMLFEPRPADDGLMSFALPVARRIALLHGGDLTAEHTAGGVITLYLVLPQSRVISPQEACGRRAA